MHPGVCVGMHLLTCLIFREEEHDMKSLLIRAEDKNIWERRSPIIPVDMAEIIKDTQCRAFVQKSRKRFFSPQAYKEAGAEISDDMNAGDVILGVKEIPVKKLIDDKVYLFFSHTIKGQKYNMPMLKKIIDGRSTLIDYERIADDQGRRKVFFGRYAGDAGALDILWLMGEYYETRGINTPLQQCKQASQYQSVEHACQSLRKTGEIIKKEGFPGQISPLVIGILGYGNVSQGAQFIFDNLPTERIAPEELKNFYDKKQGDPRKVYLTIFKEEHLVKHRQGKAFELDDYYKAPVNYEPQFEQYLPFLSIIVNATYWDNRYPRFVTWDALKRLYESTPNPKLCGIADITCDVNGSIECNVKTTDSGTPAYCCNPLTREITDGHKGDGIVLLAVDNLPAELPHDASTFFSNQLKPFVPNILNADYDQPLEDSGLLPEIKRAVIVYKGELTKDFTYLRDYL